MKKWMFVLLMPALLINCKKEQEDFTARDQELIAQYIQDHNLDAQATASGLHYVIEEQGSGNFPTGSSNVTVKYKGYLTNGAIFDQSKDAGITFNLSQVIKGWQEGIPKFRAGGSGILLIPSALGYGGQARPDIPANSVLIFEIELKEVL